MEFEKIIEEIRSVKLQNVSYSKLASIFQNNLLRIPITTAIIPQGTFIERGRPSVDMPFVCENEISYISNSEVIEKYGRGNRPKQSRFYGSVKNDDVPYARVIVFSELCEEFRNATSPEKPINITIGQWEVIKDIEVAEMTFSSDYFTNSESKDKYDNWIKRLNENSQINNYSKDYFRIVLEFFSNEFSKPHPANHHEHKLSALYTDFVIHGLKLAGVAYPSVQTKYRGYNLVLEPHFVEKYIRLKQVAEFSFIPYKEKGMLVPIATVRNLGPLNSSFEWERNETIYA